MTRVVTFKIDEVTLEHLDCLVKAGFFESRSEAIREAILRLLEEFEREHGDVCSQATRVRLYRCPVCGEALPYHDLRRHVERHIWTGVGWKCPFCGRKFPGRRELLFHLANTADERHALLWALVSGGWHGKGYAQVSRKRKELLEKLIVR